MIPQRENRKPVIIRFTANYSEMIVYVELFEKVDVEDSDAIEDAIMSYLEAVNDEFHSREEFRQFITDILQAHGYSFEFLDPIMDFYI